MKSGGGQFQLSQASFLMHYTSIQFVQLVRLPGTPPIHKKRFWQGEKHIAVKHKWWVSQPNHWKITTSHKLNIGSAWHSRSGRISCESQTCTPLLAKSQRNGNNSMLSSLHLSGFVHLLAVSFFSNLTPLWFTLTKCINCQTIESNPHSVGGWLSNFKTWARISVPA